ncbi:PiggyBac transposable element-derived protein 4 [Eumeta japonica]|uniref:PiggyBac transposable element-derived protein 4 n=1 Tax=Eumeta variegata TaxID=151549 RepID=A0A4C1TC47_EUMVA|nr:PiggyBac transposable element-derived protein 4 [Eumeta japonica]
MMPNILSLPPKKIQQNLSNDEELPPQVAASARFMEAEMDVDHEKLLSGDVNFKWQRDFTAFTAVREVFCPPSWCDNDKQPLPMKAENRLLPVTNQLLTALTGKTTKIVLNLLEGLEHKGHCVTMDNFYNSPALARYLKCRGFDCLGTERLTRKNIPEDVKEMKKNCEKGTIIACHPAM